MKRILSVYLIISTNSIAILIFNTNIQKSCKIPISYILLFKNSNYRGPGKFFFQICIFISITMHAVVPPPGRLYSPIKKFKSRKVG